MALARQTQEEISKETLSEDAKTSASVRPKTGARPAFLVQNETASAAPKPAKTSASDRRLRLGMVAWVLAAACVLAFALKSVQPVTPVASPVPAPSAQQTAPVAAPAVAATPTAEAPPSQGQSFIPPQDITSQIVTMPRPANETPEAKGTRKELLSIISQ